VSDESHADDLAGDAPGLLRRGGELDAAAFAAAAGVYLRLDRDRHAEVGGDRRGLVRRGGDAAAGDGHAVSREDFLSLVLVDLHETISIGVRGTLSSRGI